MENRHSRLISLEKIPANRQLVDQLFARGLIGRGAREYALALLYPARNWGLWVSRVLLAVGATLILSGIVYFFAFNWAVIPGLVKLGAVAAAMVACLGFAHFYGLERRTGQVMLLAASVMTGVFLAVFGQVYQTGADAWNLFAAWAALILPWVAVSGFAGLWVLWLGVANIAIVLWWDQAALAGPEWELLVLTILAAFNSVFLAAREVLAEKFAWLGGRWTRLLLGAGILGCAVVPAMDFIMDWNSPTVAAVIGGYVAPVIIGGMYYVYRCLRPDMYSLAATVLSACVLIETAAGRLVFEMFRHGTGISTLLMGLFTIALFGGAVIWLRSISEKTEVQACPAT